MAHKHTALLGLVLLVHGARAQAPNIIGYEYWFDQNDAARVQVAIPATPIIDLSNASLNTTELTLGQHVVNFRLKDQQGSNVGWSSVVSRALQVGQPAPWEITAMRYWWSELGNPPLGTDLRYLYFDELRWSTRSGQV